MSAYTKIERRIWNDSKFRSLSDNGKLVFFFILTHPHQTPFGAMRASVEGLAQEIGWGTKAFGEALAEASRKGMVKVDPKACFILLPNYPKHNKPESPNVLRGWFKSLAYLPECELYFELLQNIKDFAKGWGPPFIEAMPQPYPHPSPNQEQEQEQEQEKETVSEKCQPPLNRNEKIPFKEIIDHLNTKAGASFRHQTEATRRQIRALFKQGFTLEDFFAVINHKSTAWAGDPKMSPFIRPQTLFSGKFEAYLQEAGKNGTGKPETPPASGFYSNPVDLGDIYDN